jgi:CTP synthase (UTP-ammonia lyase)
MQILNDFNTSVEKALGEIDPKYKDYPGVVICGTHSPHDIDALYESIQIARVTHTPFLGICFGHQLAAIEYARNVLGQPNASSEEIHFPLMPPDNVVVKRSQLKVGLHEGESWWNNYEVVEGFEKIWQKAPNFITCQYHPEYQSSKEKPHPLLVKFLNYAKG